MYLIAAYFELIPIHHHKDGECTEEADFSYFQVCTIRVDRLAMNLLHPVPDQIANSNDCQNQTKPECIICPDFFNIKQENN